MEQHLDVVIAHIADNYAPFFGSLVEAFINKIKDMDRLDRFFDLVFEVLNDKREGTSTSQTNPFFDYIFQLFPINLFNEKPKDQPLNELEDSRVSIVMAYINIGSKLDYSSYSDHSRKAFLAVGETKVLDLIASFSSEKPYNATRYVLTHYLNDPDLEDEIASPYILALLKGAKKHDEIIKCVWEYCLERNSHLPNDNNRHGIHEADFKKYVGQLIRISNESHQQINILTSVLAFLKENKQIEFEDRDNYLLSKVNPNHLVAVSETLIKDFYSRHCSARSFYEDYFQDYLRETILPLLTIDQIKYFNFSSDCGSIPGFDEMFFNAAMPYLETRRNEK